MRLVIVPMMLLLTAYGLAGDKATEQARRTPSKDALATVYTAKTTAIRHDGSTYRPATYLGIHVQFVEEQGLVITSIDADAPAAKVGVKVGDRLRMIEGEKIVDPSRLRSMVQERLPGSKLTITIEREQKPLTLSVPLGVVSQPLGEDGQFARRVQLGIFATPTEEGFRVDQVVPSSPADRAGFKPGDIIARINGRSTERAKKISDMLIDYNPGDRIKIEFRRDGKDQETEVTLSPSQSAAPRGWDDRRTQSFRGSVYKLAVLPIEYRDQKLNPKITREEWDRSLFSENSYTGQCATGEKVHGSLRDYYHEVSGGKLRVEGKVFSPVDLAKNRMDYATGNRDKLFEDVLNALFDRDGNEALDGFDGLFFLYAGEECGANRQALYWPHQANFTFRGKRYQYFICNEGGKRMESISVLVHEFGHLLGMPDLYAKPELPNLEGVGVWCTMASGHGNKGRPLHFSAWCKEQLDWVQPTLIDPTVPQRLVISPIENNPRECFKVLVTPDASEYLLLEYRTKKGFDQDLPAEGLLIWRIIDGRPVLEESHGAPGPDGATRFLGSVPYPSPSNRAFTPYTIPSSLSNRRGARPVHITNIRKLPDGRIAFDIGYELF